ncbi:MAG TPA: serine/threonine-protein kinase [Polyangiaceae bacterium]
MQDEEALHLAKTLAARMSVDAASGAARTLVDAPHATIEPPRPPSSGAMAALDALRALGVTLSGRIAMHRTLGEGGMGVVHLATQETLGRHVAVKTVKPGVSDADAAVRILREAWVTGLLEHPNVVPVHDVGIDASGSPVIVMKRIEGHAWSELMRDPETIAKRFGAGDPLEWNLRTFASACNAIHFAHARGILHRDIKPDNVMIGEFGEVYVVDWGIAVSLKDDPSGRLPPVSLAKDLAGTPHYMAPEMVLGDPALLSPRTDVYLLGAVFYEVFAGEPPHHGASLQAMITDILLSSPRFPASFPAEARRICSKAMARDPAHRFASAQELRLAVEEYVRHRGSRKLAHDAKVSAALLEEAIRAGGTGEERRLAIANRLGECRFGYHAALSAWPGNEAARQGLDRALLMVVEYELAEGDAAAAATLLRDVSTPPPGLHERVEAAVHKRHLEEERLRKMEEDHDPRVGTRTRSFLGGALGLAWTASTLFGWLYVKSGRAVSYFGTTVLPAAVFLVIGMFAFVWARETLSRTQLNRRFSQTVGFYLVAQMVLGAGGWLAGIPWQTMHVFFLAVWMLTYILLAVWAERWFALPAAVCGLSFLVAAGFPPLVLPLMSLCNLVLTVVLVKMWFPRDEIEAIRRRRAELRRRAERWLRPSREEA